MAKISVNLEFETIHNNRNFLVQFEAYKSGRNLLMGIIHNGLPIDTVELIDFDKDLFNHIKSAMINNANSHYERD